uniref:Endoplasmic reticulum-Golgi intermediate compartment protein 3-like n=1 Tax=Rhizophora mucronata TaxID=61149 RepID=A0A2P2K291_RHIMU
MDSYNVSHRINRLAFGDYFPGIVNPLDGAKGVHDMPNGRHQYFIKVVPTIYKNVRGRTVNSNQYSVTDHYQRSELVYTGNLPGVFFFYDFSPIKVTFEEEHISFLHFITNLCAIIGGIFYSLIPKENLCPHKHMHYVC